nr:hypothetical protein [uncultured Rhodopila sp.]
MTAVQPSRITIPDSAIQQGSIVVPLHVLPFTEKSGEPAHKVGIVVALTTPGDPGQTTGPVLFEFDTGGQGFWANYAGLPKPTGSNTIQIKYDSGIEYIAVPTALEVAFPEASAPLSTIATVALIETITPQPFPIFGQFYGDFGAALQPTGTSPELLTVLAQLPYAQGTRGFIVDLGTCPPPHQAGGPARLIVGLTDSLRALFPNRLPMTPAQPYTPSAAATPIPTFGEILLTAGVVPSGDSNPVSQSVGVVFDTGAATTVLHAGEHLSKANLPANNQLFQLIPTAEQSLAIISVNANEETSVNQIQLQTKPSPIAYPDGYVNTGLVPFFNYPIMFDLEHGMICFPSTHEG